MSFDINEYLKIIEEKKEKEVKIKNDIAKKEKEFKEYLKPFKDSLIKTKREIGELKAAKIFVRLGDLVEELSNISGINIDSINVEVRATIDLAGYKNVDELLIKKLPKERLRLLIVGSKNYPFSQNHPHPFYYSIKLPFNFNELQASGKPFIEHCTLKIKKSETKKKEYIEFLVTYNIEDIICNFSLSTLIKDDKESWYPSSLLKQAIINCVEKKEELDIKKPYIKKTPQ